MTPPHVMVFHSTHAVGDGLFAGFVREVGNLFGGVGLSGDVAVDTESDIASFDSAAALAAGGLGDWRGTKTVVFGDGRGLAARCDLLRLAPGPRGVELSGASAGYRTHVFSVEIEAHRRSEFDASRLYDAFAHLSECTAALYGAGQDNDGFLATMHARQGLEAGLPGIFELTTIGPPFVELIGRQKLLALPDADVRNLTSGGVAMHVPATTGAARDDRVLASRDAVVEAIGREYFRTPEAPDRTFSKGGQIGLLSFVSAMLRSAATPTPGIAAMRPRIDWSGVFAR